MGNLAVTPFPETSESSVSPAENPLLHLRAGQVVRNAVSGRRYRVGRLLGAGGFGAVYRVSQASGGEQLDGELCLKVTAKPECWHREAYFGYLLQNVPGVIGVYESFAWMPQRASNRPLYCLITEFAGEGDLALYLKKHPEPWPEWKARREIIKLLRTVTLFHDAGAVHRDITPQNVFVTSGRVLKLGDFGIAAHGVGKRDVPADIFKVSAAPTAVREHKTRSWKPADDVYHLGQLYAMLVSGSAEQQSSKGVKALPCSAEVKSVIQRCIGERRKRFTDSAQMLSALEKQDRQGMRPGRVYSLKGKRVVFTGGLTIPRKDAGRLVKQAGGTVEWKVSSQTQIVIVGERSVQWKADSKGQKLLEVDRERELGHHIALLSERRFLTLTSPKRSIARK